MRTVAFCEIEPFCRAVLRKHWTGVPIFEDVRTLTARDVGAVDVICGGFPCQDISLAGKGAGLGGERSGLWTEYARLIGEVRPRYAIIENVSALRSRGLDVVLGSLAALGYDAEWHCIPASAVGAPHRRDRVWIIAHSNSDSGRQQKRAQLDGGSSCDTADRNSCGQHADGFCDALADANIDTRFARGIGDAIEGARGWDASRGAERTDAMADADCDDEHGRRRDVQVGRIGSQGEAAENVWARRTQWSVEPDVGRVANGIPSRVDRLKSLGNAVVPQIPEIIGRAIMRAEGLAA